MNNVINLSEKPQQENSSIEREIATAYLSLPLEYRKEVLEKFSLAFPNPSDELKNAIEVMKKQNDRLEKENNELKKE